MHVYQWIPSDQSDRLIGWICWQFYRERVLARRRVILDPLLRAQRFRPQNSCSQHNPIMDGSKGNVSRIAYDNIGSEGLPLTLP